MLGIKYTGVTGSFLMILAHSIDARNAAFIRNTHIFQVNVLCKPHWYGLDSALKYSVSSEFMGDTTYNFANQGVPLTKGKLGV